MEEIITANHEHVLHLADGTAWGFRGTGGTESFAREFAAALGIAGESGPANHRIRFIGFPAGSAEPARVALKIDQNESRFTAPKPPPVFGFPGHVPGDRPDARDVILVLRPAASRRARTEQMRRSLLPVYRRAVLSGGLPFHAALIEHGGRGVLLAGPSGAGKSTACRRLPYPWRALADDLCLAVPDVSVGYRVHPLPTWSAFREDGVSGACRSGLSVPLRALFFIEQFDDDECRDLKKSTAAISLAASAVQVFRSIDVNGLDGEDATVRKGLYANAASTALQVPSYLLRLSLHGRFWEKIEEVLEKGDSPLFRHETGEWKTA